MSDKHISFTADKKVWKYLKRKAIEEETTMKDLILRALRDRYGIGKKGRLSTGPAVDRAGGEDSLNLSDLDPNLVSLAGDLKGGDLASDTTIKQITLACLRYLQNHGEVTHSEFKKKVYPDFEDSFKEDSFWKIAKNGLKQIESMGGPVKTPKGRGHSKYIWK